MKIMWYEKGTDPTDAVIGCEITAVRNINSIPFSWRLSSDAKRQVISAVKKAMSEYKGDKLYFSLMEDLTKRQAVALAERRVITPEFLGSDDVRALIMSEDEHLSVMIFSDDHIRIRVARAGRDINAVLDEFKRLDEFLDNKLHFAFDEKLGYLGPDPTVLGTGMNVTALVSLPGLTKSGELKSIASSADRLGISISAMFGTQINQVGDIYAVTNRITMGLFEEKGVENLALFTDQLTTSERNAAESFAGDVNAIDMIHRSAQIASGAKFLSTNEMLEAFSWISLGISVGIIKASRRALDPLIFTMQPASLNVANREMLDVRARDELRAKILSSKLKFA